MTKQELVNEIAMAHGDVTKKNIEAIVKQVFTLIGAVLAKGEKVAIPDFGTFDVKERAARKGRNPQTGEEIEIAASKNVHFKAGKALKNSVNA